MKRRLVFARAAFAVSIAFGTVGPGLAQQNEQNDDQYSCTCLVQADENGVVGVIEEVSGAQNATLDGAFAAPGSSILIGSQLDVGIRTEAKSFLPPSCRIVHPENTVYRFDERDDGICAYALMSEPPPAPVAVGSSALGEAGVAAGAFTVGIGIAFGGYFAFKDSGSKKSP